jgi:molybdenum-dependent DNA-binding transcriptional regulator ModE
MGGDVMPKPKKPITIRGVEYPSRAAAARALGITYESLRRAMQEDRLDTVGLKPRGKNHGRRVRVDGKRYPSIWAASKATGIPYGTLRDR